MMSLNSVDRRAVVMDNVQVILYKTTPVICRVVSSDSTLLQFKINDDFYRIDMNALTETILEKLYEKLYRTHFLIEKDKIKAAIRTIEEYAHISRSSMNRIGEMTREHELKKGQFNKDEVLRELERRGYPADYIERDRYSRDVYLVHLPDEDVEVKMPLGHSIEWAMDSNTQIYDYYTADDIIEHVDESMKSPDVRNSPYYRELIRTEGEDGSITYSQREELELIGKKF